MNGFGETTVTGSTRCVHRVIEQKVTDPADDGGSAATPPSRLVSFARFAVNRLSRGVMVERIR